jgi:hypothetical protein
MREIIAIVSALSLASCASSQVATDARCVEVRNGNAVLAAANRFIRENRSNPSSLSDLMPKYLSEMPRVPELEYSPSDGGMRFFYYTYVQSEEFGCECKAKLKQREFKCHCLN